MAFPNESSRATIYFVLIDSWRSIELRHNLAWDELLRRKPWR